MAKRKQADAATSSDQRKRCRFGRPRVKTGILSAGTSAAASGERAPLRFENIDIEATDDLSGFFDVSNSDRNSVQAIENQAKAININRTRMIKALRSNANEEALRNAVYGEFRTLNELDFPPRSAGVLGKYKEQHITNLCDDVISLVTGETTNEVLNEYEQDLLVKNTSKPDIAVIVNKSNSPNELKLGEFKQGQYDESFSIMQDCLYLTILLYMLRVKAGMKVNDVFGFAVCGHKCTGLRSVRRNVFRRVREEGEYRITFIKLSAPTTLGNNLRVKTYSRTFPTNDITGIQLLAYYLMHGKVAVKNNDALQNKLPQEDRSPSLLLVPSVMWGDPYLKTKGTGSVVFGPYGQDQVLGKISDIDPGRTNIETWEGFKSDLQNYIKDNPMKCFYIKLHLRHYVRYDKTNVFLNYHRTKKIGLHNNRIFFETYPIEPFTGLDVRVIISVDRGNRIVANDDEVKTKNTLQDFCNALHVLCTRTVDEAYVLGDALPHNIVEDNNGNLFFIDYDEGVESSAPITRRIVDYTARDDNYWLRTLEYPNHLVESGHHYTKVQLGVCVLQLLSVYYDNMSSQAETDWNQLEQMGQEFGKHMFKLNTTGRLTEPQERDLQQRAQEFYNRAMALLSLVRAN